MDPYWRFACVFLFSHLVISAFFFCQRLATKSFYTALLPIFFSVQELLFITMIYSLITKSHMNSKEVYIPPRPLGNIDLVWTRLQHTRAVLPHWSEHRIYRPTCFILILPVVRPQDDNLQRQQRMSMTSTGNTWPSMNLWGNKLPFNTFHTDKVAEWGCSGSVLCI